MPTQLAAALLVAAAAMVGSAGQAAAATSHVYISYPTWLGNCPAGGSVTGIHAANGALWSTPTGGDWGDDLIYPKVNLNSYNTISARVYCDRSWWKGVDYWGATTSVSIRPTRGGQTFWVGPAGKSHN